MSQPIVLFQRVLAFTGLLLLSPGILRCQERERVSEGMRARLVGGGFSPPTSNDLRDTTISFYPGARFYYADIPLEHGGHFRMYGATDAAGQVYLLDSPASFRLLHKRHFQGKVDSVAAVSIGRLAARFGGQIPSEYRITDVNGYLMQATTADSKHVPFAWDVTVEARGDREVVQARYWIAVKDGDPQLMSRECDVRCRATIFDP